MKYEILFGMLGIILVIGTAQAANWQCHPTDCPVEYNAVSCTGGKLQCGIDPSDNPYCFDMNSLNAPGSNDTSNSGDTNQGGCNAGFVVNCEATDASEPYCDNSGGLWCNRNTTCYGVGRKSVCLADIWSNESGASGCGACRTDGNNFFYCDGDFQDGDGCEVRVGTSCGSGTGTVDVSETCFDANNGNCTSSTRLDCDDDDSDSDLTTCNGANGCEILNGGACTLAGLTGTYAGCNCNISTSVFRTGTFIEYSTNDTQNFLWGKDYGSGFLFNLTNDGFNLTVGANESGHLWESGRPISADYMNRSAWTTIDNYPSACSAGQFVSTIGDTLTCSTPPNIDTNASSICSGAESLLGNASCEIIISYPGDNFIIDLIKTLDPGFLDVNNATGGGGLEGIDYLYNNTVNMFFNDSRGFSFTNITNAPWLFNTTGWTNFANSSNSSDFWDSLDTPPSQWGRGNISEEIENAVKGLSTAGGFLGANNLSILLNSSGDTGSFSINTTATIEAEQLTSGDDITMLGRLFSMGTKGESGVIVMQFLTSQSDAYINYTQVPTNLFNFSGSIESNRAIKAGGDITAGDDIIADDNIDAGDDITAGANFKVGSVVLSDSSLFDSDAFSFLVFGKLELSSAFDDVEIDASGGEVKILSGADLWLDSDSSSLFWGADQDFEISWNGTVALMDSKTGRVYFINDTGFSTPLAAEWATASPIFSSYSEDLLKDLKPPNEMLINGKINREALTNIEKSVFQERDPDNCWIELDYTRWCLQTEYNGTFYNYSCVMEDPKNESYVEVNVTMEECGTKDLNVTLTAGMAMTNLLRISELNAENQRIVNCTSSSNNFTEYKSCIETEV